MAECSECGEQVSMPFRCKFCGEKFCSEHRLPENHECEKMGEYFEQREDNKIMYDVMREEAEYRKSGKNVGKGKKKSVFKKAGDKVKEFLDPQEDVTGYSTGYQRENPAFSSIKSSFPEQATFILLGLIIIGFVLQNTVPGFFDLFKLVPEQAFTQPWRLITPIFVHGDLFHLFVNGIVLYFFGAELEYRIGTKRFLKLFFTAGILASAGYSLYMTYILGSTTPAVGASGAIYGVFAALAILAPEIRVLAFFVIPMGIRTALVFFALFDLFLLTQPGSPIASIAHLTGLVAGVYYGWKIRKKGSYRRKYNFF